MPHGMQVHSQHPLPEHSTLALPIQKNPWVMLQYDSTPGEDVKPCGRHCYSKGMFLCLFYFLLLLFLL